MLSSTDPSVCRNIPDLYYPVVVLAAVMLCTSSTQWKLNVTRHSTRTKGTIIPTSIVNPSLVLEGEKSDSPQTKPKQKLHRQVPPARRHSARDHHSNTENRSQCIPVINDRRSGRKEYWWRFCCLPVSIIEGNWKPTPTSAEWWAQQHQGSTMMLQRLTLPQEPWGGH